MTWQIVNAKTNLVYGKGNCADANKLGYAITPWQIMQMQTNWVYGKSNCANTNVYDYAVAIVQMHTNLVMKR